MTDLRTALVVVAIFTLAVQFNGLTGRPEGFHIDESAIAYNAWSIAERGVDEHGRPWPLFFESFGDWKPAPVIYMLAGVFAVTGPNDVIARALSAMAGALTVATFVLLAWRVTRRPEVALLTGLTVLLLPWTFEPTRLVFEVAYMPALLAGLLLALFAVPPGTSRASIVVIAGLLALITYTYTLGRLLGPLLALGLVVYARGQPRSVVAIWALYGGMLAPFGVFELTHPGR